MNGTRYLYLEHDGKIFLVDDDGSGPQIPLPGRTKCDCDKGWSIRLPTEAEAKAAGLEWVVKRTNLISFEGVNMEVVIAFPEIDWPSHWAWKDAVISDSAVHPLARESVYRTIHRLVSKVLIVSEEGKVVMAKVKRGHFVGAWTLPGGYLDYSEHPEQGALRETLEELGIEIDLDEIAPMISQNIFTDEGINFVSFTYRSTVRSGDLNFKPKQDEIAEVAWLSKEEALDRAVSWFDRKALENL